MIARPVWHFLVSQFAVSALLSGLVGLGFGWQFSLSFGVGALIGWLATAYLALQTFRVDAAKQPGAAMQAFYRGVAGRFVLVAVLFIAVFVVFPGVQAPALFLGFGVAWAAQLMGSAQLATGQARDEK